MDRTEISRIAHLHHPVAAPVDTNNVRALLSLLSPPAGARVVDLGCGQGEWLLELLTARPDLSGVGVDVALPADLDARARERGVGTRVQWVQADAANWDGGVFDVVFCVGASHAFGGLAGTLDAVRDMVRPGGQVLLGDTTWDKPPSKAAQEALEATPEDFPDLLGLVKRVQESGFEPGYGHVSTLAEWDDYEWSWTGSLTAWALAQDQDSLERAQALEVAREHRLAWLGGYRRQLGFATLLLHDLRQPFVPPADPS
ncbi:methyltransferase [Kineococcus sp. R8]|uniref:class I SAM-dependent methyltransferase n=1 Tax=Kineococcus siccus TaxID=2696567 RepID=UPI001411DC4E|nr:class I SAM-dependent methyltransferase [Kineococcus siccus]NAZ84432.1 methyltransferase [Kineococcus siccus]